MQRSALCRSRRELSNSYLLAKFGIDTAENEPSKVCRIPVQLAALQAASVAAQLAAGGGDGDRRDPGGVSDEPDPPDPLFVLTLMQQAVSKSWCGQAACDSWISYRHSRDIHVYKKQTYDNGAGEHRAVCATKDPSVHKLKVSF